MDLVFYFKNSLQSKISVRVIFRICFAGFGFLFILVLVLDFYYFLGNKKATIFI